MLRKIGRNLGINKIVGKIFASNKYEQRFELAMMGQILKGDVIWDVGANVGHYTTIFSSKVGVDGMVYAFEPVLTSYNECLNSTSKLSNVRVENIALSDSTGKVMMNISNIPNDVTNKIIEYAEHNANASVMPIDAFTPSDFIKTHKCPIPDFVKIDIEGHELSLLSSFDTFLLNKSIRGFAIEVHVAILENAGVENPVVAVDNFFKNHHYKTRWVDPSHVIAMR